MKRNCNNTLKKITFSALLSMMFFFGISTVSAQNPSINTTPDGAINGWGWSDTIGWISFSCITDGSNCAPSTYGVVVTPGQELGAGNFDAAISTGTLSGYAWSPNIGWISFNDSDVRVCGPGPVIDFQTGVIKGFARALSGNQSNIISGGWSGCIAFNYMIDRFNSGVLTYDQNTYDGIGYTVAPSIIGRASIFTEWAWGSSQNDGDGVIGWIDMKLSKYVVVAKTPTPKPSLMIDANTLTVPAPYYVDLTWYAVDENGVTNLSSNLNFTSCQAYTYDDQGQVVTTSSPFTGNISNPPSGQPNVFVPFTVTGYSIDCKWPNPANGGVVETIQSNIIKITRFVNTDLPLVQISTPFACVEFPDPVILNWTIGNADSCDTDFMGIIPTTSPGNAIITPPAIGTYTYSIKCTNDEGTTIESTTVNVLDECKGNPPTPKTKRKFLFFEF